MVVSKNHKTHMHNIDVHITYAEKQQKTTLRGYAIDASTGIRIDGSKIVRRVAKTSKEIPAVEDHVIAAVVSTLPKATATRDKHHIIAGDSAIALAFQKLVESECVISSVWNMDTQRRSITYFQNRILPFLADLESQGLEILSSDIETLQQELIEKVLKNEKHTNVNTATSSAAASMQRSAVIYEKMRMLYPEYNLPEVNLTPKVNGRYIQPEQAKSLPDAVRVRLAAVIERLVETDPHRAFALTLMFDAGLRTAEAAAANPTDIHTTELSCVIWVGVQEKNGLRNPMLKTDAAYRSVTLSYWGFDMLTRCTAALNELIPDWNDDPNRALNDSKKLSTWILQMLRQCGCNEVFLNAANRLQQEQPDVDFDSKPIFDLGAYILRRDRASRWRNFCGISPLLIDVFLGHRNKTPKRKRADLRLEEVQNDIARCLERYVYNPKISNNPAFAPISVIHGTDLLLTQFGCYRIKNDSDKPLNLHLDIEASEPNESVTIIAPKAAMKKPTIRQITDTFERRTNRPVIGICHSKEYYDQIRGGDVKDETE